MKYGLYKLTMGMWKTKIYTHLLKLIMPSDPFFVGQRLALYLSYAPYFYI